MRQGRWLAVLLVFALGGCTSFVARKPGGSGAVQAVVEAGRFPVRCHEHAARRTHGQLVRPAARV